MRVEGTDRDTLRVRSRTLGHGESGGYGQRHTQGKAKDSRSGRGWRVRTETHSG